MSRSAVRFFVALAACVIFSSILSGRAGAQSKSRYTIDDLLKAIGLSKPAFTRAPDFSLRDAAGGIASISGNRGSLMLVNFWATWCGPCRDEMPLLDHARSQYDGLEVIGVAIDSDSAVADYLKDNPVRYPILLGGEAQDNPSVLFGDTRAVLPYSVLLGRDGKILAQRAGSFTSASLASWLAANR